MTFGSKLHGVNSFDSFNIQVLGANGENGGHFDQLAQRLLIIKKGRINLPICIFQCLEVPVSKHTDQMEFWKLITFFWSQNEHKSCAFLSLGILQNQDF
jgi:hypothetical protein